MRRPPFLPPHEDPAVRNPELTHATALIIASLASFRALFTSATISQRLPVYNNAAARQADAAERRGLARMGLSRSDPEPSDDRSSSGGRSSASLPRRGRKMEGVHPYEAALGVTQSYASAGRPDEKAPWPGQGSGAHGAGRGDADVEEGNGYV